MALRNRPPAAEPLALRTAHSWENAHSQRQFEFHLLPYLWVLPALVFVVALKFYPVIFSITLSFFEWNVFQRGPFTRFIGLGNYSQLVQDGRLINALAQSLVYIIATITVQLGCAYGLATFIYFGRFSGASILLGILFFPGVLSGVIVGRIWRAFVFLRGGLIYQATNALGLPDIFLLPEYAFEIVTVVGIWQFVGFNLVIFHAGLQSLDNEVLDAARMDGAGFWSLVLYIVTPLQRHTMLVVGMLNVIFAVQLFDLPRMIGGNVLATYLVDISFGSRIAGPLGYASAIATVMIGIAVLFALLHSRLRQAIEY